MSVDDPLVQASLLGEAVDSAPAAVFVADEEMRYIAVNRTACTLTGYTRAELLGMRVPQLAAYDDAASEFDEMLRDGTRAGRSTLRRKDASTVTFEYRAGTTIVAGMTLYVSIGYEA